MWRVFRFGADPRRISELWPILAQSQRPKSHQRPPKPRVASTAPATEKAKSPPPSGDAPKTTKPQEETKATTFKARSQKSTDRIVQTTVLQLQRPHFPPADFELLPTAPMEHPDQRSVTVRTGAVQRGCCNVAAFLQRPDRRAPRKVAAAGVIGGAA